MDQKVISSTDLLRCLGVEIKTAGPVTGIMHLILTGRQLIGRGRDGSNEGSALLVRIEITLTLPRVPMGINTEFPRSTHKPASSLIVGVAHRETVTETATAIIITSRLPTLSMSTLFPMPTSYQHHESDQDRCSHIISLIISDKQNQMAQSTHSQPNTLITQTELPLTARTAQQSLFCVDALLHDVVQASWGQIKLNRLFIRCLQPYSNFKTIDNMQQLNTFLYSMAPQADRMNRQEDQPIPLNIDSLLPISADIDAENIYKKNNSNRKLLLEDSTIRSRLGEKESIDQREKYTKLHITEVSEEDGFTKQLRKLEEQRNMKAQGDRKASERKRQLQAQKLRDKKKNQKQQKFSYGYNGQFIEIKLQSKANLVSKVINGATNPSPTITKEIIKDPKPIEVQALNRKEKKLFGGMGKRKDDVQFSEVKSLADNIKATQGVKYTYEGKTYQEKQKAVPVAELRKTLSQRRISKDDYKRIRQLNGNKQDYEDALKKSRTDAVNRPQSQPKRGAPTPTPALSKRTELIHVNSHDLKGKLLEKPPLQEYLTERKDPQSEANLQGEEKIGLIDNFNLEYLRTGGTVHASTSKDFFRQRSDNELPRITHTTLYSKVLPKGRERIKEANEIIRDLRKKFEQKLRV